MGFFDSFKGTDINAGVESFKNTEGAMLIDVRGGDEYRQGHIPGSINVPLAFLSMQIGDAVEDLETPLFVYCLSGGRSAQAKAILDQMGYKDVKNIGGISRYKGPLA